MKFDSRLVFGLCVACILYASFSYYPKWQKIHGEAIISWDVSGYYWYLPAVFIYGDLKNQAFAEPIRDKYKPGGSDQSFKHEKSGHWVNKYSLGMSLNYLPAFLLAHAAAKALGFEADGFSRPYQLAIQVWGLLFFFVGLWYWRRFLLLYFRDSTVSWTLMALVLGSNYLNYAGIDVGMSHGWLFTWYVLLLWHTQRFYAEPSTRGAVIIGAIIGMCALIRPTEIIAAVIPGLWGLQALSKSGIAAMLAFYRNNLRHLATAAILVAAIGMLQVAYWKYVSGDWFVYSYGDQEFSWLYPHFRDYIFSVRCGWLIYTPIMLLAYVGFLTDFKPKNQFWAILVHSVLFLYIVSAWDIWWYGGRAMIQSYAVLGIALASFLEYGAQRRVVGWVTKGLIGLCIFYNVWYTHGLHKGGYVDLDDMKWPYFRQVIGDFSPSKDYRKLMDTDEYFNGQRNNIRVLLDNNLEQDSLPALPNGIGPLAGRKSDFVNKERQFSQVYRTPLTNGQGNWVRATANVYFPDKEWEDWKMTQFSVKFTYGGKKVKEKSFRIPRIMEAGEERPVFFDVKQPDMPFDAVEMQFWNAEGDKIVVLDNLKLEAF